MPHWYNCSAKYDKPKDDECRIIHFHGNKHCRIDGKRFLNNADLWYNEFEKFRGKLDPYVKHDRQLRMNLYRWDDIND